MEPKNKSGGHSPKARATLEEKWAALSPDEQARVEESLTIFTTEVSKLWDASREYQKNLLRRLGVRTNFEDSEELWVQIMAAAEYVGVSPERFWDMTPRELAAVLEHRATELDLLRRASPTGRRARPSSEPKAPAKTGRPKSLAIHGEKVAELRGTTSQLAFARRAKISVDVLQCAENKHLATNATVTKICEYARRSSVNLKPKDLIKNQPQ